MRETRGSVLVYFEAWILTLTHIRAQILNSIPGTHGMFSLSFKFCVQLIGGFKW